MTTAVVTQAARELGLSRRAAEALSVASGAHLEPVSHCAGRMLIGNAVDRVLQQELRRSLLAMRARDARHLLGATWVQPYSLVRTTWQMGPLHRRLYTQTQ